MPAASQSLGQMQIELLPTGLNDRMCYMVTHTGHSDTNVLDALEDLWDEVRHDLRGVEATVRIVRYVDLIDTS